MNKINLLLRLFLLAASAGIIITGLSEKLQKKRDTRGLIPNQYRFGDLYNVTNLHRFKQEDMGLEDALTNADKPVKRCNNVDLYTIGDSFTTMDISFYAGRTNRHIWLGLNVDTVRLNPDRQSILVIELIERTIQERLRSGYRKLYIDKGFQFSGTGRKPAVNNTIPTQSFLWDKFNEQINQRLEFLLFNFDFMLKIKELKAEILLAWFNRTHPGAIISKDHQYVFYDIEPIPKVLYRLSRQSMSYRLIRW